ncbi:hypothetical protein AQJ64_20355 [Streptomyces griseoruber]|uniref:Uncharacterized protein n=1 Tax=Streptomyces griseoruber TaxID=1943 RepID=A0A101SXV8_9ACTN|nr:hypothetical protein AQJ64_20355 [Streptomyces griseoruber]
MVALLIDVALCAYLLGARRGWDRTHIAHVRGSALPSVAMVILMASGIGEAIGVLTTTMDVIGFGLTASLWPLM